MTLELAWWLWLVAAAVPVLTLRIGMLLERMRWERIYAQAVHRSEPAAAGITGDWPIWPPFSRTSCAPEPGDVCTVAGYAATDNSTFIDLPDPSSDL